jgi:hypothetical protein
MRITIEAESKEIADIADKLQGRQELSNDMLTCWREPVMS